MNQVIESSLSSLALSEARREVYSVAIESLAEEAEGEAGKKWSAQPPR